ncbi:MAG TPA: polysaccharide deacetylase [Candidatus Kapabacteria bacterium]|nr:polysaccharide deacetylase [Candidatus Kapabacteria bacterium]
MIKHILSVFFLCCLALPLPAKIYDYQLYFAYTAKTSKETQIITRKFRQDNQLFYLTVGTNDLETKIVPAQSLPVIEVTWTDLKKKFADSAFFKVSALAAMNAKPNRDAGITCISPSPMGIYLTIDLCPSTKPLKRSLFNKIISVFGNIQKPIRLSISITGLWMQEHPADLKWILDLIKNNEISVVWLNHSFYHHYKKGLALTRNFLLTKGTNIDKEILNTEIKMIENGIIPSVFFRFPGLISDEDIYKHVMSYGLIPIGANAWLAKSEIPGQGGIVLVHGNGNEPLGIKKFFELLQKENINILAKKWGLLDLCEGLHRYHHLLL